MRRVLALAAVALAGCSRPSGAPARTLFASVGKLPLAPGVGPRGGAVDRLFFAFHGDTRPARCDDRAGYPAAVIRDIYREEAARGVQFAVDLGDHMYVCDDSLDEARAQMRIYRDAARLLGAPTFYTLGNHDCGDDHCVGDGASANLTAFLEALAPTSEQPWYRVEVMTSSGLAVFVFVAGEVWSEAQARWLDRTLADADRRARYTIVVNHHPLDDERPTDRALHDLMRTHHFALLLTGHTHLYLHDLAADPAGRAVRMGCGGAPLYGGTFFGYGTVQQGDDDRLYVRIYDQRTDALRDEWSVPPSGGRAVL